MSTILDALKRVQDESDPHSLRESVTQQRSPRPPRRGGGGSIFPLIVLLVFAGICAGAWFVWPGQETLMAYVPFGADAPGQGADATPARTVATSPNSPAPSPRIEPGKRLTPEERQQIQKERMQRASNAQAEARRREQQRRADATRLAAAAPPVERPPATDRKTARAPSTPQPKTRPAPSPARTRTVREAPKTARTAKSPPAPTPAQRNTAPVRSVTAPQQPRTQPLIDTGFSLEPAPPRSGGSTVEVVDRYSGGRPQQSISIESVRWHPDPKRREVTLLIEGSREVDAREGDVVSGMLIHRIDPGTIEIREGDHERMLSLLD